jgi:hypothetical protein
VAWISASSSASRPGGEIFAALRAIVVGTPSGMSPCSLRCRHWTAMHPVKRPGLFEVSALNVYRTLCGPWSTSFLTPGNRSASVLMIGSALDFGKDLPIRPTVRYVCLDIPFEG